MYDFYDTSALLVSGQFLSLTGKNYVPHLVLRELENIKTSTTKDEEVKCAARNVIRNLLVDDTFTSKTIPEAKIAKIQKSHGLPQNNDGLILAEAIYLAKCEGEIVNFYTADSVLYLLACDCGMVIPHYTGQQKQEKTWSGWGKYYPTVDELALLYSDPKVNILKARTNEYCEVFVEDQLKDVLRWDGQRYQKLKYKDMRNPHTQEVVRPRNLEQKMAFDLLQNQDIKVKVLFSSWGSGKTMLALTYALEQVAKGNYDKIVFVRNNIIAKDTKDIGFLPSGLREKMSIWNRNVADHVGGDMSMEQLEDEGIIETFPLSHMRGRSLRGTICLVDECENLTDKHITLLLSRIEENSEIIFCGDASQCDLAHGQMTGMNKMITALAGEPLFGAVKLIKSERGPVPRLCDKIVLPR